MGKTTHLRACRYIRPKLYLVNKTHGLSAYRSANNEQNGMTHGFVVEFASAEDRDYYVTTDPAHQDFVKSIGDVLEKPVVLDFSDGVY